MIGGQYQVAVHSLVCDWWTMLYGRPVLGTWLVDNVMWLYIPWYMIGGQYYMAVQSLIRDWWMMSCGHIFLGMWLVDNVIWPSSPWYVIGGQCQRAVQFLIRDWWICHVAVHSLVCDWWTMLYGCSVLGMWLVDSVMWPSISWYVIGGQCHVAVPNPWYVIGGQCHVAVQSLVFDWWIMSYGRPILGIWLLDNVMWPSISWFRRTHCNLTRQGADQWKFSCDRNIGGDVCTQYTAPKIIVENLYKLGKHNLIRYILLSISLIFPLTNWSKHI